MKNAQMGIFDASGSPVTGETLTAALGELERAVSEPAPVLDAMAPDPGEMSRALQQLSDRDDVRVRNLGDRVEVELDSKLLFASGEARIQPAGIGMLREIAAALVGAPAIRVEGHTDDRPVGNLRFASNWELSAARAASVVDVLAGIGIAPGRMGALGYGEHRPVADNGTPAGRERNRRVVIVAGMDDAMFSSDGFQRPDTEPDPGVVPVPGSEATLMKFRRVLELPGARVLR